MSIESLNELAERVSSDPAFEQKLKNNLADELNQIAKKSGDPLQTDVLIYRLAVGGLLLLILTVVASSIYLAAVRPDWKAPDFLISLASTALGAVAGLIAPQLAKRH